MGSRVYVDTSVLVAYYVPEPASAVAELRLRAAGLLTISWLVRTELASALAKKCRRDGFSPDGARAVFERFDAHAAAGHFRFEAVTATDYECAAEWMREGKAVLRTVDALHLSIAARIRMPVLTADRGLAEAGTALGVPVELLAP